MRSSRRDGFVDPMLWYLVAGLVLLAASLWMPWFTAARTARAELRADRLSELLLRAVEGTAATGAEPDPEHVLAVFFALAAADGVFLADVERLAPPAPEIVLALINKHYAFQLAPSPIDPTATVGRGTTPSFEVTAWPLGVAGPGHSVYFQAEDAPRAYTRNLTCGFHGLGERRPPPGAGQRRDGGAFDTPSSYRSNSDERWMLY